MVEDNDLSGEALATLRRIVLGVSCDITTTNFLHGNVLDVEADVVSGETLGQSFYEKVSIEL